MKAVRNILVLLMSLIFMVSSSGYVLYTSSCLCTGEKQTSVFLKPETCETSFHEHHEHDILGNEQACAEEDCHECQSHTKDCGCESLVVFFFKLDDKATSNEFRFVAHQALHLGAVPAEYRLADLSAPETSGERVSYCDSPPIACSSLDFLIRIQQLKIPSVV